METIEFCLIVFWNKPEFFDSNQQSCFQAYSVSQKNTISASGQCCDLHPRVLCTTKENFATRKSYLSKFQRIAKELCIPVWVQISKRWSPEILHLLYKWVHVLTNAVYRILIESFFCTPCVSSNHTNLLWKRKPHSWCTPKFNPVIPEPCIPHSPLTLIYKVKNQFTTQSSLLLIKEKRNKLW